MSIFRYAGIVILLLVASCTQNEPQRPPSPHSGPSSASAPLRVCVGTSHSLLMIIAQQKGFFAREGLRVDITSFLMGRDALEAMLADRCDAATSSDTPVADYGRKRDDFRVISSIASMDRYGYIAARRNTGIRTVADLKGRRVGVAKGTGPHYFLDLVLNKNLLTEQDLKLTFMDADTLRGALLNGTLEAIATSDLNALRLKEELGDGVVLISDPGISRNYGYISLKESTLATKRDQLKQLLTALKAAEQWAAEHPAETSGLLAAYLKISPRIADRMLERVVTRLSLETAMIMTLEDNARWLKEREGGKTEHKSFRRVIRSELLQEVAPESVSLN